MHRARPLTGDNLPSNVTKKGDTLHMASQIKLFNLPKNEYDKFLADIGLTAEQVNRFERRVFLAVRAKQTPKKPVDRRCTLNPHKVRQIRRVYGEGKTSMRRLANYWGVRESTIFKIVHGRCWKSI
jgi:peptide deformylase